MVFVRGLPFVCLISAIKWQQHTAQAQELLPLPPPIMTPVQKAALTKIGKIASKLSSAATPIARSMLEDAGFRDELSRLAPSLVSHTSGFASLYLCFNMDSVPHVWILRCR